MAVGGVDHDDVHVGLDQGGDPLVVVDADGGADPQPAALVPGGRAGTAGRGRCPAW